jgi:hypothetical protein
MMAKVMEIFVDDNPDDVALTLRAFRQHNLACDVCSLFVNRPVRTRMPWWCGEGG